MKRLVVWMLASVLCGALAWGCGPVAQPPQNGKPNKDYSQKQMTSEKSFELQYKDVKDNDGKTLEAPPLNKYFSFTMTLRDSKGNAPAAGVKLIVDAQMPEHGHGMNTKPEVVAKGEGVFEVKGMLFHMPGWWEMKAEVDAESGKESATFNVYLDVK